MKEKNRQKRKWLKEEEETLKNLCQNSSSFADLKERVKNLLKKRNWESIKAKIYQKKWTTHFEKKHPVILREKERRLPLVLEKGPKTLAEVSALLDVPKEEIFPIRDKFAELGYNIQIEKKGKETLVSLVSKPRPGVAKKEKPPKITTHTIKVLVVSDLCFGLKTQQPTLLHTAYKIAEEEGVWFGVIAGNIVAGIPKKGRENDYFLQTAKEQLDYASAHIPKAPFKTVFISGPRDLTWQNVKKKKKKKEEKREEEKEKEISNIGEELARARQDLSYAGDLKITLPIGKKEKVKIGIMCANESSVYTKSYPLQGMAENLQEAEHYVFEHSEPLQMILVAGLQTALYEPRRYPIKISRINDFDKIAIPSLCRPTPSQLVSRRRGGSAVLGFLIVSFELNEDGYLKRLPEPTFYNLTSYFKENDYCEDYENEIAKNSSLNEEEKKVLNLLSKKPRRKGALARLLNISEEHVQTITESLQKNGFQILFDEASKCFVWPRPLKKEFQPLASQELFKQTVKTAHISDTHIGHKYERPDLLKKCYEIAEGEKVAAIFHCGDVFEGEDAYKGQLRELLYQGADSQLNHGLEIWPLSKIPTFIIMGTSHEKVFVDKCGYDIVNNFCRLGRLEKGLNITNLQDADGITASRGIVEAEGIKMWLGHLSGGLPYGRSYRPQKLIEVLVSEMELMADAKIIFCGHLHVGFFMFYKGMAGFLVPGLQEKTRYIEAKGYSPWMGMWICQTSRDRYENIIKITLKYIPFEPQKGKKIYGTNTNSQK